MKNLVLIEKPGTEGVKDLMAELAKQL